jgi:DNA invertase Pin-like site-specific DNA recombinase
VKHQAIYVRISSKSQNTRSQLPDLRRWELANANTDNPIQWYEDTGSGKSMQDRPGWQRLYAAVLAGKVSSITCWRLDRLGRSTRGLVTLFEELQQRKVGLISMREGLDLSTPAGRLMCHILASISEYETELRGERVAAGQAVARARGVKWGGSKPGVRKKVTATQLRTICAMRASGERVTAISRTVGLSRPTIYSVLKDASEVVC